MTSKSELKRLCALDPIDMAEKLKELQIAADGYRKASTRREDDDRLIEEGGGFDLWLGRLLNALGGPDGLEGNR